MAGWLVVVLVVLTAVLADASGNVTVHLQISGVARGDSGLTWKGSLPELTAMSVCARVKLLQTRETNYVVSYATSSFGNEFFLDVRYHQQEVRLGCCMDAVYLTFPVTLALMKWIHLCVALDLRAGLVHFQEGGNEVVTQELKRGSLSLAAGGVLMLGQDQDTLGGGTEASQSLHGYITDLVLAAQVLTHVHMHDFTTCHYQYDIDPVVDFSKFGESFSLGAETMVVDLGYERACTGINIYTALFPEPSNLPTSRWFCAALGASLIVPKNALENDMVTSLGQKYCQIGRFWLGVHKSPNSSVVEYGTNHTLNYTKWDTEIKEMSEYFGILYTKKQSISLNNWGVSTPDRRVCTVCGHDKPLALKVRGLCAESKFDRKFHIYGYNSHKPSFVGIKSSSMSWTAYNLTRDVFSGFWKMWVTGEPHITAKMVMETNYAYSVGSHSWMMQNDICVGNKKRLKFTTCPMEMFTCNNGLCIDVKLRCDKKVDCVDSSDEERCNSVIVPKGYDQNIPPPFLEKVIPAQIAIEVEFKFIRSIKILEFTLSLDLRLTRRWRDGRLRFKNLHHNLSHNLVEDVNTIWLPELIITGADSIVAQMQLRKDVNFVDRQGSALLDDNTELDEDQLYSGAQNDLVAVREWTLEMLCHYDLSHYPFDTQRCPVSVILAKYTSDIFKLRVDNFTFSGDKRHHQYLVHYITLSNVTVDSYVGQQLLLTLRNQYIYYISAAYVPSSMLIVVSYITYYFRLEEFQTRISVALTSLLVLATLFSELVGGLPKTSYLKLIDIWFLGCIAANFGMVVCLVIIEKGRVWETKAKILWIPVTSAQKSEMPKFNNRKVVSFQNSGSLQMDGGLWFKPQNDVNVETAESKLNTWMKVAIPIVLSLFVIVYCVVVIFILNY